MNVGATKCTTLDFSDIFQTLIFAIEGLVSMDRQFLNGNQPESEKDYVSGLLTKGE